MSDAILPLQRAVVLSTRIPTWAAAPTALQTHYQRGKQQDFVPVSMEPGNLQRPSATSIQGFLPELGRFQAGVVRERGRVLDGVRWRK